MAKFSVVEGMFGINPEREDDPLAKGIALAQLSPEQQVSATGYAAGSMLGSNVAKLGASLLGYQDERQKTQVVKANISARLQEMGADGQNPEQFLPIVIEEFQKAGMPQQAMAAATELRRMKLETQKAAYEAAQAGSTIQKNMREQDPILRLLASGHYDPKSVKAFQETGDAAKLVIKDSNSTESKQLARFNELTGKWKAGELDKSTSEMEELKALYSIFRGKEVAASVFGETPTAKNSAAMHEMDELAELSLKEKNGIISDKEKIILDTLRFKHDPKFKPPDQWETQLTGYAVAGSQEWDRAYKRWKPVFDGKMAPPNPAGGAKELFTFAATVDPNTKMTREMIAQLAKSPELAEYLSDVFSIVYGDIRLQSGAAITAHEFSTAVRQFVPLANDTMEGRKSKIDRMLTRVQTNWDLASSTPFGNRFLKEKGIARPMRETDAGATTADGFDARAFATRMRGLTKAEQATEWRKLTKEQKEAVTAVTTRK